MTGRAGTHGPDLNPEQVLRAPAFGLLAIGLAIGAILGVAVGARLSAKDPNQPHPSTTAVTADVLPDSVSQRLRDAYYGGGGAVAVCVAAETIVCSRATPAQSTRAYGDVSRSVDPTELAVVTPLELAAGRIFVVGDLGPVGGAAVARIDGGVASDGRLLIVANPDRQGIDYLDLGPLGPGTYLVSIDVTTWQVPTALVEIVIR